MDRSIKPKDPGRSELESQAIRYGIQILNKAHSISKSLKIYDSNNSLVQGLIQSMQDTLQQVFQTEGAASFLLHQDQIFFNQSKLKFSYSSYPIYKYFMEECLKREIGSLQFKSDIQKKDLESFLNAFSKKMEGTPEEVKQFHDTLRLSGTPSISLTKLSIEEKKKRKQLGAKKIYFLSMSHLKDVFKMDEADKKSQMITTKRLIKAIYDNILDDSTFLLGLTTLKNYDDYTLNHCVNVSILALGLGKRLGLDKKELVELGISSFFHDIGKVSLPIEILNKPGKLDEEERKIIETHPLRGAEQLVSMLQEGIVTPKAINVAMEHHAVSGSRGYPRYVKKKNIDIFSKIVKIVDVFDALTTKRPYRKKDFTREEALNILLDSDPEDYDPLILKMFAGMIGICPVGTLVLLNTDELAIVFDASPTSAEMLRPRVKLITDSNKRKIDGDIVDLTEKTPEGRAKRSIVKSLDPADYDIRIADYFMEHIS